MEKPELRKRNKNQETLEQQQTKIIYTNDSKDDEKELKQKKKKAHFLAFVNILLIFCCFDFEFTPSFFPRGSKTVNNLVLPFINLSPQQCKTYIDGIIPHTIAQDEKINSKITKNVFRSVAFPKFDLEVKGQDENLKRLSREMIVMVLVPETKTAETQLLQERLLTSTRLWGFDKVYIRKVERGGGGTETIVQYLEMFKQQNLDNRYFVVVDFESIFQTTPQNLLSSFWKHRGIENLDKESITEIYCSTERDSNKEGNHNKVYKIDNQNKPMAMGCLNDVIAYFNQQPQSMSEGLEASDNDFLFADMVMPGSQSYDTTKWKLDENGLVSSTFDKKQVAGIIRISNTLGSGRVAAMYCEMYSSIITVAFHHALRIFKNYREHIKNVVTSNEKTKQIQEAIEFSWLSFMKYSPFHDDLKPITKEGLDNWMARATYYDSLDTLFLAGLFEEFDKAVEEIEQTGPPMPLTKATKVFEYSIRIVGGFLGAFSVSGNILFRDAAVCAADALFEGAFSESLSIFPRQYDILVLPNSCDHLSFAFGSNIFSRFHLLFRKTFAYIWHYVRNYLNEHRINSLAGVGTFSLEFEYLSLITGNFKYKDAAKRIFKHFKSELSQQGLDIVKSPYVPIIWNVFNGKPVSGIKFNHKIGGGGDSYYEYLLKIYVLNPDNEINEQQYRSYVSLADSILKHHAVLEKDKKVAYPTDFNTFSHLLCFVPGILALDAHNLKTTKNDIDISKIRIKEASQLAEGCAKMYSSSITGLSPEERYIRKDTDGTVSFGSIIDRGYFLRPEFVESLYVLHEVTSDDHWKGISWDIFLAINKSCRLKNGYSGLQDVTKSSENHHADDEDIITNEEKLKEVLKKFTNEMPSFYIAETLKYLLLTFSSGQLLDFNDFVFTTEAHPLQK